METWRPKFDHDIVPASPAPAFWRRPGGAHLAPDSGPWSAVLEPSLEPVLVFLAYSCHTHQAFHLTPLARFRQLATSLNHRFTKTSMLAPVYSQVSLLMLQY